MAASARSLPALTLVPALAIVVIITCTWLLIRSTSAGDEPLYGTLTNCSPVRALNRSTTTLPVPAMAIVNLPGLALAQAMASLAVFGSKPGLATRKAGERPISDTGVKSFTAS